MRRLLRFAALAPLLLIGVLLTLTWGRSDAYPGRVFRRLIRRWYRAFCWVCGLQIHVFGRSLSEPALQVSNHVSWLDIPILGTCSDADFLSKSEVRHWPLVGWLSSRVGTLFIRRGEHGEAQAMRQQISHRLAQGETVHVFPEGTTTDGQQVRRFHHRLFAAAADTSRPVQPVALVYPPDPQRLNDPAFIDDAALLPHAWGLLGERRVRVEVHFLPPLAAMEQARELSRSAEQVISGCLSQRLNREV
ncbi:lyso-ornithine lipid acyltransferase [Ectothiorhodosinus mongolicus]|uniref:Lyso-ornithine lipid acyltransferase n=2 Tax=Ectothiorhodosinus mongolicus TaxID=233100 RepID=A0A1R3W5Z9_9GAMM|nr:lysophospholipid acyltransferase family protein [Ectothiorhodosinus mongolicus]ULX57435.1 1-acyl-sn-glycerol-3-phosphate acyltransferase [Ectothiorhodosinus mongolicus]SIT72173.1 lyso-ornithine lipid acyltransferase [Ectothiorhodosinus mongolicus]